MDWSTSKPTRRFAKRNEGSSTPAERLARCGSADRWVGVRSRDSLAATRGASAPIQEEPSRPLLNNDNGAIMLLAVFFAIFALALVYSMVGVSQAAFFRAKMQDGADAAALSGALMQARSMNLLVLLNIIMAALLSVLVALKLVEALAMAGSIIAAALAYPTSGASLAFVPPFEQIRQNVKNAHDQFEPPITEAIEAVKTLSDEVARAAPGAARGVAKSAAGPPVERVSVSMAEELPVEDDDYKVLCGKAGELPIAIAEEALPFPRALTKPLKDAMNGMASTFSDWFCGDEHSEGGPPAYGLEQEVWYPAQGLSEQCEESGSDLLEDDLTSIDPETTASCAREQADATASVPDGNTGECLTRCDVDGPYEKNAQLARETCHPANGYTHWAYQVRTGTVEYEWDGAAWRRLQPTYSPPGYVNTETEALPRPPCGPHTRGAAVDPSEWNFVARPTNDSNVLVPVCTTENEQIPAVPFGWGPEHKGRRSLPVTFEEVPHVFACAKSETIPIEVEGEASEGSEDRAPKRVDEDLEMGSEPFQVRVVAEGTPSFDFARRMVGLARYNQEQIPTGLSKLKSHGGVHVAQAEYFYDTEGEHDRAQGRDAWMWNMNWNARLTRFRAGEEGLESLREECPASPLDGADLSAAFTGGNRCTALLDLVEATPELVTH